MVLVLRPRRRIISCEDSTIIITSQLWLVLIHVELRNCPVPDTNMFGILSVNSRLDNVLPYNTRLVLDLYVEVLKCNSLNVLHPI